MAGYIRVTVTPGRFSEQCLMTGYMRKRSCFHKAKYMVFDSTGGVSLSNLESSPCECHLLQAIKRALEKQKSKKK